MSCGQGHKVVACGLLCHTDVLFGWHSTKDIIWHLKIGIWNIS